MVQQNILRGIAATKSGSIALAILHKETRYSWHIMFEDNKTAARISKKDLHNKFFRNTDDADAVDSALLWING